MNLSRFVPELDRGRCRWIEILWLIVRTFLISSWIPGSTHRILLLRVFGCSVGQNVTIKPGVRIKFPWRLRIGSNCWLGEDCWIDNLALVSLCDNVCISQGAYICTGNHDWSDPAFRLVVGPVTLKDGAWVGARCIVGPGVVFEEGAIGTAGSVITRSVPRLEIHQGNPAHFVRIRELRSEGAVGARRCASGTRGCSGGK